MSDYGTKELLKVLKSIENMTIEEYNELYEETLKDIEESGKTLKSRSEEEDKRVITKVENNKDKKIAALYFLNVTNFKRNLFR